MSTLRILFESGSAEVSFFLSKDGRLTREDLERLVHGELRRREPSGFHGKKEQPSEGPSEALAQDAVGLLVDLLATWMRGRALALHADGSRRAIDTTMIPPLPAQLGNFLVEADQVLAHLFTSGTTGRPECSVKTAAQLLGEARILGPLLGFEPGAVVLSTVPLHHLYGLLFGLLAPLQAGATIVLAEAADPARFHPHRVARATSDFGVTHLVTIPAHIQSLVDARVTMGRVRQIVSSAAPLTSSLARKLESLSSARVVDVLGSTETGGIAWRRTAIDGSYRPLPGVVLRIDGDDRLLVDSPFASGEGPIRTGDRGRVLQDGSLEHWGRDDGVVKVGGKRFSLQELEGQALEIPGVTGALAFARPTSGSRASEVWLVAVTGLERRALRAELARRVDPLLMPRRVRTLPRLPVDARGKVQRALVERYLCIPGFDLLDLSIDPLRVEVRLRDDSPRLVGHFPGAPVLPAVAQLLDLVVPEVERLSGARVVAARRLKWRQAVLPGQSIVLTVEAAPAPRPDGEVARTPTELDYRYRLDAPSGESIAGGILTTTREPA